MIKHRGRDPTHGPHRFSRFGQASSSQPSPTNTRSDCYYCNRFGKLARKCGHNDAFLSKKSTTDRFRAQRIQIENTVQRANPNTRVAASAPPVPSFSSHLPSTPPPPYEDSLEYVIPPPQYEQRLPEVIVEQPRTIMFKWNPVNMNCPYCHRNIVTKIRSESGLLAWLLCGAMFLTGLWPFCLIPFYLQSTQDVIHICPVCKSQLGSYKPL
ncbi:lipopolysaccharide-induced tumor necrosis factor-alpha factor like [Schistosoma japonicum]|nr:lipopolysaccharide-induced tumor necrosis factor-alpha factor like [Schistosoma japonicum]KAH8868458.1 lipopolysaccharide-induced tumor necrosis factor-alpha factor like [Schistosoma japonicum]